MCDNKNPKRRKRKIAKIDIEIKPLRKRLQSSRQLKRDFLRRRMNKETCG